MSMIEWVRKENKKNLVLFVHGLKGGLDSWDFDHSISFPKLLAGEADLVNVFDIACFNYFTTFTNTYGAAKSVWQRLFGSTRKLSQNLPVDELSELLITEIDITLSDYDKIIIVAHSMGGLVTKNCILKKIKDESQRTIAGFISLAVPHSGALLAKFPSLISSNAQLVDLNVLSDTTDQLNRDWLKEKDKLPITKYIYGSHDIIVNKKSALPMDSVRINSTAVDEDHFSICKPNDNKKTVFTAVKKYIIEIMDEIPVQLEIADFVDESQYDNEYFVLKMMIADVHEDITRHAKEYYYNAELARNIFTSDHDREILSNLYRKIRMIYQEEYEFHIANKTLPDLLISRVHSRISNEDKGRLDSLLRNLDTVHKKGMLHQLANNKSKDVVWSSLTSLDSLDKLKGVSND
ncbi:hypothetical protein WN993_001021 [Yersinia enterocolitica]